MSDHSQQLQELSELWGIESSYDDIFGNRVSAPPEAVIAVLRALGAPVGGMGDLSEAIRQRREEIGSRVISPVTVVWDDQPVEVPARFSSESLVCSLTFDTTASANVKRWKSQSASVVQLPGNLPPGYHTLRVESGDGEHKSAVIVAPSKVPSLRSQDGRAPWGVFLPLYALWSAKSWGAGDFGDLDRLLRLVGERGGGFVGTLPMLASHFQPAETPSPYSPISRLFWSEFYLNVQSIPELQSSPAARDLVSSSGFREELSAISQAHDVDYWRIMSLKRRALELLSQAFFERPSRRRDQFESYLGRHPRLRDYAAFRAAAERHGRSWRHWPAAAAGGTLSIGDYDPGIQQYHMYVQWLAHEQLSTLSTNGTGLYLDLPLGVNPDGYDVWRERDTFVSGVSVGAPPDNLFLGGQNWGFPPLRPESTRRHAHHHWKSVLRHHMRHAKMLRIDHVMGLHRLFWIPEGMAATDGVYVRQPQEELYAILCLESQRHGTVIVGEDLGTVPNAVRESMDSHRLHRMYVAQFDLRADAGRAIGPVSPGTVASLNTHDTPTFAGFCEGRDIDDLIDLGLLEPGDAPGVRAYRASQLSALEEYFRRRGMTIDTGDRAALMRALLQYLTDSEAAAVLINLEDLWLEPVPHNVPGTVNERPNWRRKSRYSLDDLPGVLDQWRRVGEAVKGQ